MTRQTQKYLAARNTSKTLALRLPSGIANEKLYERLEERGYWWNGSAWTDAPRPRSRRIDLDGAGANPDLIEFRVMAQSDKLELVTTALRRMGELLGWTFVQQSGGYENRDQDDLADANKRVRVYLSFIIPANTQTFAWGMDDEGVWVGSPERRVTDKEVIVVKDDHD